MQFSEKLLAKLKEDGSHKTVMDYIFFKSFFKTIVKYAINWKYKSTVVDLVEWIKTCEVPNEVKSELKDLQRLKKSEGILRQILAYVNRNIEYIGDLERWGVGEYWAKPEETWRMLDGDCEDGAILIYIIAKWLGFTDDELFIVAGNVEGGGHCYLVYRAENAQEYPIDWCIVDTSTTFINTPSGKKRFNELKVGEDVIGFNETTQKPELTKIIKLGNRKASDIYMLKYKNHKDDKKIHYIKCTSNHPWYTNRGWIETKDLLKTDIIYHVSGKSLTNLFNKDRQDMYKRTSVRQTIDNIFTREDVRKKLSDNNCMKNPDMVEKVYSKRLKNSWKSKPEITFEKFIKEQNLPIRYTGNGSFWVRGKNPDFKVNHENKLIEVTQYGYKDRDENWAKDRAKHFEDNGFKCLVVFFDRKQNMLYSPEKVTNFVMNGATIIDVKPLNNVTETVWNIHCESHNNYFVNGLLSHNCYWYATSFRMKVPYEGRSNYNYGTTEWFRFNESGSYKPL